jgi:hypothetical protein
MIVIDRKLPDPQTHALVIGVGRYPHLEDGATPRPNTMDLGQLLSPSLSAMRFAEWLQKTYSSPDAQLGTIDLLVSAPEGPTAFVNDDGTSIPVEPADMERLKTAVKGWAKRAHSSTGNVAIFYFCGHGVSAGIYTGLLAEDFGADHDDQALLENVINIDGLHLGMDGVRARRQCFLVDACRNTPAAIAERAGSVGFGQSILDGTVKQSKYGARDAPMFFACLPGQKAYSRPADVSLFTGALIETLNQAGAVKRNGRWLVATDFMLFALNQTIRRLAPKDSLPAQPASLDRASGYEFHVLPAEPAVPVSVGCNPDTANAAADFRIVGRKDRHVRSKRDSTLWEVRCRPGAYDVVAAFPGGEYQDKTLEEEIVAPPCINFSLKV